MNTLGIPQELRATADLRGGVFVAADAKLMGIGTKALRRMADSGELRQITRGGYALAEIDERLAGYRVAVQQHPYSCLSHQSTLDVHGLSTWGLPMQRIHLARIPGAPVGRLRLRRRGLAGHAFPPGGSVADRDGLPVVDAVSAVLQVAADGDLLSAICAADQLLLVQGATLGSLAERVAGWGCRPGAARVRQILDQADPRSESPGETRTRVIARRLGLSVIPQVWINTDQGRYRVDLLAADLPLILEFDGKVKYGDGADAAFAEKRREDALRSLGYVVVRFAWSDLANPQFMAQRLRQGIRLARQAQAAGVVGHPGRVAA